MQVTPAPTALMVVESVEKGSAEAMSFLQIVASTEFLKLSEKCLPVNKTF